MAGVMLYTRICISWIYKGRSRTYTMATSKHSPSLVIEFLFYSVWQSAESARPLVATALASVCLRYKILACFGWVVLSGLLLAL